MGSGCWSEVNYTCYASSMGRSFNVATRSIDDSYACAQEVYKTNRLNESLDPKGIIRECCDSEEHPASFPVILALDVTGSMGDSAIEVSKKLNIIMTEAYKNVKDVEFAIMGIGDLAYDEGPIQMSQFESDVRIAENLDKIWFEAGGGGNSYESYTAAWYMGSRHTKLDCWKRGRKGLIITLGDEPLNPYLPKNALSDATGDGVQADVETKDLYKETIEKYDIKHIVVKHGYQSDSYFENCKKSFADVIGSENVFIAGVEDVTKLVTQIIVDAEEKKSSCKAKVDKDGLICW